VRRVAQVVGAQRGSVWRRVQTYRRHGLPGLRPRPIPGRPAYLSAEQKTHLTQVLLRGAVAAGYQNELWTLERIAKVIWQEFHVRYYRTNEQELTRRLHSSLRKLKASQSGLWSCIYASGLPWTR
jgi:transposase